MMMTFIPALPRGHGMAYLHAVWLKHPRTHMSTAITPEEKRWCDVGRSNVGMSPPLSTSIAWQSAAFLRLL